MSLRLYADVHVPRAVIEGLRLRGIDILTAQEDGAAELLDPELLNRVAERGRMLFTQDEDLLAEAARRQETGRLPVSSTLISSTSRLAASSRIWSSSLKRPKSKTGRML